jgi:hypothetical protein
MRDTATKFSLEDKALVEGLMGHSIWRFYYKVEYWTCAVKLPLEPLGNIWTLESLPQLIQTSPVS